MSDHIAANEALEALHRDLLHAEEQRISLLKVVRMVGAEASGDDPRLACQIITRLTNQAIRASEADDQQEKTW